MLRLRRRLLLLATALAVILWTGGEAAAQGVGEGTPIVPGPVSQPQDIGIGSEHGASPPAGALAPSRIAQSIPPAPAAPDADDGAGSPDQPSHPDRIVARITWAGGTQPVMVLRVAGPPRAHLVVAVVSRRTGHVVLRSTVRLDARGGATVPVATARTLRALDAAAVLVVAPAALTGG